MSGSSAKGYQGIVIAVLLAATSLCPPADCTTANIEQSFFIDMREMAGAETLARDSEIRVSSVGFDEADSTAFLQRAIDSGAGRVIVDDVGKPWITRPLFGRSDLELVFEPGVELVAKKGEFLGTHDALLCFKACSNVVIRGGTLRMHKADYQKPPYKRAEWRHALSLLSCRTVTVEGLRAYESGGDGIYIGNAFGKFGGAGRDIVIRDTLLDGHNRQGVSVITVDGLLMERVTMSNTSGMLPMAGIDFEPNRPGEMIRGVVLRDCLTRGNRGNGYELAFMAHSGDSCPIDLTFENCTSENDALGLFFSGGNFKKSGSVSGRVKVSGCTIINPSRHPGIGILVQRPISTTFDFAGNTLICGDETTAVGADWVRKHLPLLAVGNSIPSGKLPPFGAKDDVRDDRPGELVKVPWFGLRNKSRYAFYVEAARKVRFSAVVKLLNAWRKNLPTDPIVARDATGSEIARCEMNQKGGEIAFDVPAAGFYTMEVNPGRHVFGLTAADVPVGIDVFDKPADIISSSGTLYVSVPAGHGKFAVFASSGGPGENVSMKVADSSGAQVFEDPLIFAWQAFEGLATAPGGLWKVELGEPSRGRFEDYRIDLSAVPSVFFLLSNRHW